MIPTDTLGPSSFASTFPHHGAEVKCNLAIRCQVKAYEMMLMLLVTDIDINV